MRDKKVIVEPSSRAGVSGEMLGSPMQVEPEKRPVRDQKRGPFAWQSVRQQSLTDPIEHERLLIHSVSDNTALCSYLPAVREFVAWAEVHQPHVVTWGDLDLALTIYLTASCYMRDRHPLHGSLVLNGLAYLMPELARHLPRSWRAAKAWAELSITTEGQPVSLQALACMEAWLREQPSPAAQVSADMIPVAVDGYLREQDLTELKARDVIASSTGSVTLLFGRSSRGERSKTGRDQGVSLDEPYCKDVVRARLSGLAPDDRLFPITSSQYRQWWGRAADAVLGKSHVRCTPHSARHTGASRDLATGYRSFEQVQRRGRWKTPSSVQRYAKTHVWRSVEALLPEHIRQRGNEILRSRAPRPAMAQE